MRATNTAAPANSVKAGVFRTSKITTKQDSIKRKYSKNLAQPFFSKIPPIVSNAKMMSKADEILRIKLPLKGGFASRNRKKVAPANTLIN